jgi:hypothetical protein
MNAWSFSSIPYRLSPAENRFRDAIVGDLRLESGGMVFVNAGELQGLSMQ